MRCDSLLVPLQLVPGGQQEREERTEVDDVEAAGALAEEEERAPGDRED